MLNRDIIRNHNDLFSNKIKTGPVTNQNHSGRCWLFASLNVMRPDVMTRHKLGKLELSENYIAFWDKIEKANCFLEDVIETADREPMDRDVQNLFTECCQDGGDWDYVIALTKKYGEVPLEVMPETHNSANSAQMNHVLRGAMRTAGVRLRAMKREGKPAAELRDAKEKALADAYRILVMNLGEPPAKFTWRYEDKDGKLSPAKSYTPKSFWKEWVAETDLDDYVTLGNVPGQDYDKLYEISHSRDIYGEPDCRYLNVPIDGSQVRRAEIGAGQAAGVVRLRRDEGPGQGPRHHGGRRTRLRLRLRRRRTRSTRPSAGRSGTARPTTRW